MAQRHYAAALVGELWDVHLKFVSAGDILTFPLELEKQTVEFQNKKNVDLIIVILFSLKRTLLKSFSILS